MSAPRQSASLPVKPRRASVPTGLRGRAATTAAAMGCAPSRDSESREDKGATRLVPVLDRSLLSPVKPPHQECASELLCSRVTAHMQGIKLLTHVKNGSARSQSPRCASATVVGRKLPSPSSQNGQRSLLQALACLTSGCFLCRQGKSGPSPAGVSDTRQRRLSTQTVGVVS